jgi:hypothetical protein
VADAVPNFQALGVWDQCGGKGGSCQVYGACTDDTYPNTTCPAGTTCQRQGEWSRQCLPDAAYQSTGLKWWAQCGGKGGECARLGPSACLDQLFAGQACPAGTACQRHSDWYHQCMPQASAGSSLSVWDQCGGKGGNCGGFSCADQQYPGYSCPSGSSCVRQSEWYRQCMPGSTSGASGGSTSSIDNNNGVSKSSSASSSAGIPVWQQCGGLGGMCSSAGCLDGPFPGQSCSDGNACSRVNQWYRQCRPSGSGVVLATWSQCGGRGGECASYFCADGPFSR